MFPRNNLVSVQDHLKEAQARIMNQIMSHEANMQLGEIFLLHNTGMGTQAVPVPMPNKSAVLDSSLAIKLSMGNSLPHERSLMARNDIWHRIIVQKGASLDKELVLKSILRAVSPADFIPVRYQFIGEDSCFLARNCEKALEQLCKTSLIVPYTAGKSLLLSITLGFASIHELKINIQPILLSGLVKRWNSDKKSLDLDDFHRDPDIYKMVYCPLSQCKTLGHVLRLAKTTFGLFESLSLKSNELTSLGLLDPAFLKSLKFLDLRHNELLRVETLEPLKTVHVTELWLDGNPVCENYSNPHQYVEAIREYCPHLVKLDGVRINSPGLPLIFKSYVKNYQRRRLVEQFVEHFFSAYDHKNRSVLKGLYDKDSWYSTTVGTPTSPTSKKCLEPFGQENRNLLIFGKNSQQLLYHGQDEILRVFKKMPPSQHLRNFFCCDLVYDSTDVIIICVEGLFKLTNGINQIFSFNRTFVLSALEDNEFKLMNDQYHIYLPIHVLDLVSYTIDNETPATFHPSYFSLLEKEEMVTSFQLSTSMKLEHCERFLKHCEWDMRKAITMFLNCYKNEQVPKDAFYGSND